MSTKKRALLFLVSSVVGICACLSPAHGQLDHQIPDPVPFESLPDNKKNILLIIADDMGVDCVEAYGEHPEAGHTPVIDSLAANGVLFRNAWSYPTCSPSRACMLTGRHAFRTGIGYYIDYEDSTMELSVDEITIPKVLKPGYRTAAVGKWHLSTQSGSGLMHPMLCGFDHHRGTPSNFPDGSGSEVYYSYEKAVDGVWVHSDVYATTDAVNDALELIESFGNDPWFVWLAFNAPHAPFHKPPEDLHSFELPPEVWDDIPLHVRAAIEAMDTEIGRLISSLDPKVRAKTIIIFLGDNGTAPAATTLPFLADHAKTTLYEGGVNVPLIVSGPGVCKGAESDALVSISDLLATIAEIAEVDYRNAEDSVSMVPYFKDPSLPSIRPWAYAEKFKPNGFNPYYDLRRTAREARYKLMYIYEPYSPTIESTLFFDLQSDPFELVDLMEGGLTPEELIYFNKLEQVMLQNERGRRPTREFRLRND